MRSAIPFLALLVAAPLFAGEDPFASGALASTEHRLVAELSLFRIEGGLPPLAWCERMAMPMRLHLQTYMEAGYRGEGDPPASVGRVDPRARKNHAWTGGEIFANFGLARKGQYDHREQIDRMLSNTVIRSYTDPEQNAASCVMKPIEGDKVLIYLAVAKVGLEGIEKELDNTAEVALLLFGGGSREEENACRILETRPVHEGLPLYLALLGEKKPNRRLAGVRALGALADPAVVPGLIGTLSDRDAGVRRGAKECLVTLAGAEDPGGDRAAWTRWWETARASFKPKGKWSPPPEPAEDPLPEGGEAPPPPVDEGPSPLGSREASRLSRRALAAFAPGALPFVVRGAGLARDAKTGARLLPLLSHGDFPVRWESAVALARSADKSLFPKLAGLLRVRPEGPLLAPLYEALGRTSDRRAVKLLGREYAEASSDGIAALAARALGFVKDRSAVQALISILGRSEAGGRKIPASSARTALETLTGAKPGETAASWESWWSENRSGFTFPD